MAYTHPAGRGSLFKNHEKETETQPDYDGEINVEGVIYFLNAWLAEGIKGKYMKLSVRRKDKQPEPKPEEVLEDDVPF